MKSHETIYTVSKYEAHWHFTTNRHRIYLTCYLDFESQMILNNERWGQNVRKIVHKKIHTQARGQKSTVRCHSVYNFRQEGIDYSLYAVFLPRLGVSAIENANYSLSDRYERKRYLLNKQWRVEGVQWRLATPSTEYDKYNIKKKCKSFFNSAYWYFLISVHIF